MKSTLVSLRRSPSKILQAIEKRQAVTITKRGRPLAKIVPSRGGKGRSVSGQLGFGMWWDLDETSVDSQVRELRNEDKSVPTPV